MDILNSLREQFEKKDAVHTKIIWKVVEENDTLFLVLPNIHRYIDIEDSYVFNASRETITEIIKNKAKYTVVYIPDINYQDQQLRDFETLYNIELQWLPSLEYLHNDSFMEHHHPRKMYLLSKELKDYSITNTYFNKAIVDTISTERSKDIYRIIEEGNITIHHGINFLEETINIRVYMNKLITRMNGPFHPRNRREEDYDVAFILGNMDETQTKTVMDIIIQSIKQQQCAMIFSCNQEISKKLPDIKKEFRVKVPLVDYELSTLDSDVLHELIGRIERVSKIYTTFVFIGKFELDSKEKEIWSRHLPYLENVSLFEPFAFDSLGKEISNKNKMKYRISHEIESTLSLFLEGDFENIGVYTKEENKDDPCDDDEDNGGEEDLDYDYDYEEGDEENDY